MKKTIIFLALAFLIHSWLAAVQLWNTFLGSSATEMGWSIAVDGSGNTFVTGYSDATIVLNVTAGSGMVKKTSGVRQGLSVSISPAARCKPAVCAGPKSNNKEPEL